VEQEEWAEGEEGRGQDRTGLADGGTVLLSTQNGLPSGRCAARASIGDERRSLMFLVFCCFCLVIFLHEYFLLLLLFPPPPPPHQYVNINIIITNIITIINIITVIIITVLRCSCLILLPMR